MHPNTFNALLANTSLSELSFPPLFHPSGCGCHRPQQGAAQAVQSILACLTHFLPSLVPRIPMFAGSCCYRPRQGAAQAARGPAAAGARPVPAQGAAAGAAHLPARRAAGAVHLLAAIYVSFSWAVRWPSSRCCPSTCRACCRCVLVVTCWLPFPCCSPGLFQTAWPPVLPICLRAAGTICSLQLCRRVHALFGALHRLKRSGTSAGLRELAAKCLAYPCIQPLAPPDPVEHSCLPAPCFTGLIR